jgi:DNA-binding transcriptional LysR family regulator
MDLQIINTFLEVATTGSFVGAAERMGVSQAAVSMRIQALETQLGRSLFDRGRGGAKLTARGRQFYQYAITIKRMWDRARLEVSSPTGYAGQIRIAGHYSLWRHFLMRWFEWMRREASDIAVYTEAHTNSTIMQLLGDGMLDIGVTFNPEQRPGLVVERLFAEELILVSTEPNSKGPSEPGYLFVDWGPEFQKFHFGQFDQLSLPGLQTNLGAFAVEQILGPGGSGYFPEPVAQPFLQSGRLHRVEGAPRFNTPIYAVYEEVPLTEPVRTALRGLREMTRLERR